ncbi:DoxX family protein [Kribbella flavida DSM 17836]|uniref:DoxX family protein n=1 Tax=Kribbella flavida (strain DSM 17836 / JCM 10339 / NBRC 14399) TaxID=479435 RepID=D2PKY4_KRIFD|nr:DoxX family protein [Kribbella flavida]ADB32451.1 DoxX family protein [Kribbella flavida DSM 17836]
MSRLPSGPARSAARDAVLLIARIGLGVIFIAHGWQKFRTNGLDATAAGFDQMGVPAPTLSAYFAAGIELIGGAALILGVLTSVAGVLLALNMAGALVFVHLSNGIFASEGGWELVAGLGLLALTLAAVGPGRFSVDAMLNRSTADRASLSV